MSIPGPKTINVGLPNESANSDSLFTAFEKTRDNFANLFELSSPYNTFTAGAGITASSNANTGTVTITNTGVTNIIAGLNIVITPKDANGNVTISANTGSGGSGLSSVGVNPVSTSRLVVTNTPLVTNGNMTIDLANSGVTQGTYNNPTLTVDNYGRIVSAANGNIAGTVTSVGLVSGPGIQVSGGPITSNGNITVTNIGVTRINAGSGIVVSSGNGNVTISAASLGGTVTSVGLSSSQLVVTGSPVVSSGTIGVNLPNSVTFSGNVTAGNVYANSGTIGALTLKGEGGNVSNIQGANISGAVASATTAGTVTTAAQPNVTSVGTLANLSVTGNTTVGNLVIPSGNIIYTPRYGSFYSNVTQTNPVANTAMAMTFNNTNSANGVSITSSSRLTVAKAGVYNIQFSAQFTKTDAGTDYMEVWLSKNGTSVPWTNTRLKLVGSNVYEVASWNFVETLGASEYVQLMWGSSDLNAQIVAIPSANTTMGIDVPSVIVTVTPVGA
jgi:hypothetical protein